MRVLPGRTAENAERQDQEATSKPRPWEPPPQMSDSPRKPRVLAVSSGGGHWVQLQRLTPAFADCDVAWATVRPQYREDLAHQGDRFHVLPDATRWNKLALLHLMFRVVVVILKERPDAIITTGAAPGYFALLVGRLLRKRTCWIDSIANIEELSLSGRKASRWATLWLTQWEHLSTETGPYFHGCVLSNLFGDSKDDQESSTQASQGKG